MIKDFFCYLWCNVICAQSPWTDLSSHWSQVDWFRVIYWIAVSALLVYLSVCFLRYNKTNNLIEWVSKKLQKISFVLWCIGCCVYMIGYYDESLIWVSVLPRAILSSFKMFAMSYDITHVTPSLQHDAIYASVFMLVHFASVFVTSVFVFKLVKYKVKSYEKIRRYNKQTKDKVVHMFWGVNNASCLLAEDIHRCCPGDTIVMIDIDEECDDCSKKKTTLNRIMNTITISDSEIKRLDNIDALVDHCYNGPSTLADETNNDIFMSLDLKSVGEIVQNCSKLHCYFLSDNETNNILGALNLQRDWRIQEKIKNQSDANLNVDSNESKVCAYIHARKDSNNEIFDHYSQYDANTKRMKFKLVDSAYLSVEQLKKNDRTLPVNCVVVDRETGTVNSPFTALIIGFGGTGQEAFKFLYEYAAFIDQYKKKTPFKCYAIDENMDNIAGLVRAKMPAIHEDELELIKTKVDSELFWQTISNIINHLNYVVITLNDDLVGLSYAVNLFKYALKYRSAEYPMLKIMIRCYDRNNEIRMREVIDNLNNSTDGSNVDIQIFGEDDQIYTYNSIVSDGVLTEAKEFNRVYENSEINADEQWEENFGKDEIKRIMDRKKVSRYHAVYDVNRRIAQNCSNSLHGNTKMLLMGFGETDFAERLEIYYGYVSKRETKKTSYNNCPENDAQLLRNMAIVEHERWIASHKLMGYVYASKTDIVRKHHECMRPFAELDEETQSYDCNVVDTTIKLAYQKMQEKNNNSL